MLEGWLAEVGSECGVRQLSGEGIEVLDVFLADFYLLLLLFVESAQLMCLLLCLLLWLFGRSYLWFLLYLFFSVIIQTLLYFAMVQVATLGFVVRRVRFSKAKPLILVLLREPAFLIFLVEPGQPIVITSCIVLLLPGQYLEHTRLFIPWDVLHTMSDGLLLRVKQRRSLPHYSNNNNTIHHPTTQPAFPYISIFLIPSKSHPFKI